MTRLISESADGLELASKLLLDGELVAFPTETVYGLGALYESKKAVDKIYNVKKRPRDNPLIVHIATADWVYRFCDPPKLFFDLAKRFSPGPITYILPYKESSIALRIPAYPFALNLIKKIDKPVVAPSANISGRPSPTKAAHVLEDFDGKIPLIVDGGMTSFGIESTVVNLLDESCAILRPGALSKERLEDCLGKKIFYAKDVDNLSPGVRYKHYAPRCKVLFVKRPQPYDPAQMLLSYNMKKVSWATAFNAKNIFSLFRIADKMEINTIHIILCDALKKDYALMNRLQHVII